MLFVNFSFQVLRDKNYYEFTKTDLPEMAKTKYDYDVKKLKRENKKVTWTYIPSHFTLFIYSFNEYKKANSCKINK